MHMDNLVTEIIITQEYKNYHIINNNGKKRMHIL